MTPSASPQKQSPPTITLRAAWAEAAQALAAARLGYGHGCANAEDEAAWLVLHAAGLPATEADQFDGHAQQPLSAQQLQQVRGITAQRIATRQPLAYLLGEAWLVGLRFTVDSRVIVPRSFIAELLDQGALDPWLPEPPQRILDLCTGSGCLAVLAALAWDDAQVDALDLSPDALAVAHINRADYALQDRVQLIASDLWSALGAHPADGYDLVLCNPPYVPTASMQALPEEYRHEPALALAGGADGMDLVRRLLQDAPPHLSPHGVVVLEVGNERKAFEAAFPQLPAVWLDTELHPEAVCLLLADDLRAAFAPGDAA
ncbi:MAG: 50S ribosomal protein L3 N(5)-glutamine methyltransferase [Burkholderiaceae bacterium]|nr:50S ribosomal protein L3 N(5)-glutamine methyltransferase [Burkholderiaceae bacterium]